jgi:ATP-binding cassette, subfamily B, bacterial
MTRFARRPAAFILRCVATRPLSHLAIVAAVAFAAGCAVSTQYGIKFLIDTLGRGPGKADGDIWVAFAFLVLLIVGDTMSWRLAGWVASRTFVAVTGDVRAVLFGHLLGHAPRYFTDRPPGVLTSRVTATSNALFTLEYLFTWNVLPPIVATLGAVAFLVTVSPAMTAGLAVFAGLLVVLLYGIARRGWPLHRQFADKAAAVDGEMTDIIGNIPLVRSFGGFDRERRRLAAAVGIELGARVRSLRYIERLRLIHASITVIVTVLLLAWILLRWSRGEATTGEVVLVTTLALTVLNATRDLAVALVEATQHLARLAEALETLAVPHEIADRPGAEIFAPGRAVAVRFEHVRFTYPGGAPVFDDFNLTIGPGERVGLVGESGGGKSTIFALLQRFYEIGGGRILIDGRDIAEATQDSVRAMVSVVPQDPTLFHRTIIENVRYARPDASNDDVRAAIAAAHCTNFIDALPEGLMTVVGDRGAKLSAGQRQRIAIARALLKDSPILLLDEATSALDLESEEAVRHALGRLMRNRTVIAIAHRLSTLRDFDRIVVLDRGSVIEDGAPGRLMRRPGVYRNLVSREAARLATPPLDAA